MMHSDVSIYICTIHMHYLANNWEICMHRNQNRYVFKYFFLFQYAAVKLQISIWLTYDIDGLYSVRDHSLKSWSQLKQ